MMLISIEEYRRQTSDELENILAYWMEHTVDVQQGGFVGKVDNDNKVCANAPKGSVLNSRILYTFSAAFNHSYNKRYLQFARRAFDYMVAHFIDAEYGGVYWTVESNGKPADTKKQVYAIAFAIYALAEYYKATADKAALLHALQLYNCIEQYCHDFEKKGYIEALTREWQTLTDLRLSAKDANEKKTMNTHLHVLEAYTNLYSIFPGDALRNNLIELIYLFLDRITHPQTHHLQLYFDEDWNSKSATISYGHDIEAAWLVQEAAELLNDAELLAPVKQRSVKMARAAIEGLDKDGGLWYEREGAHLVKEKHWWPQAEAMVGFYNAWQLTGEAMFFEHSIAAWAFIQQYILNREKGEWFWGVKEHYAILEEDKVGIWKCPYHNGRACVEIIKRTSGTMQQTPATCK